MNESQRKLFRQEWKRLYRNFSGVGNRRVIGGPYDGHAWPRMPWRMRLRRLFRRVKLPPVLFLERHGEEIYRHVYKMGDDGEYHFDRTEVSLHTWMEGAAA